MQRTRWVLGGGLVLGLCLSLSAPAQAQVYYVHSSGLSGLQTVPVAQSVVTTESYITSGYGSGFGRYGRAQAWNNRRSAPAVYSETRYFPETTTVNPGFSSQAYVASGPIVSSGAFSAQPVVVSQSGIYSSPVTYSHPIVASRGVNVSPQVVYSSPVAMTHPFVSSQAVMAAPFVIYADPIVISRPALASQSVLSGESVRVYQSVVSAPRVVQEAVGCRSARQEVQSTGITTQAADGRRVKTYRYEHEVESRPGKTRVTIDFDE